MNIDDIITPSTFSGLTKKQLKILDLWYDNNCEGMQFVASELEIKKTNVQKSVNSEIGKKYLKWRATQDGSGKINKDAIMQELKNIAFANYDDCYEVVKEEDDKGEIHELYLPKNFAKMSKRERRKVKSAIGLENGRNGTKFTMNMKAKMEALEKLSQLADALNPEETNRTERSGKTILSRIKKLSKLKGVSDAEPTEK